MRDSTIVYLFLTALVASAWARKSNSFDRANNETSEQDNDKSVASDVSNDNETVDSTESVPSSAETPTSAESSENKTDSFSCQSFSIHRIFSFSGLLDEKSNESKTEKQSDNEKERKPSRIPPKPQSYSCQYTVCFSQPSGKLDETAKITIDGEKARTVTTDELAALLKYHSSINQTLNTADFFNFNEFFGSLKNFFGGKRETPCLCPSCPKEKASEEQ